MATNTELINEIISSKLPVNWVTAKQFSMITGIPVNRLTHRKQKWQEGLVWYNDGKDGKNGNVYYSLEGYNKWQNHQAEIAYQQACGLGTEKSKSTSPSTQKRTTSRYPTHRLRKVSRQPLSLEAS